MPHKEIGIVVAMRREVAPLLARTRPSNASGIEFYELENTVFAVGGIGRQAASRATEALVERYSPSLLVSAGIAGALAPKLKVGQVVRAREVVDSDSGARFVTRGGEGTVVTVSAVSGYAEKQALAARWMAAVIDMEASAVAAVAQRNGIEFAAVKSISDELDFEMPPLNEFVTAAGKFETLRFAVFLLTRPKWWGAVRQLSANSHTATVNLSHELQHLTEGAQQVTREARIIGV